MKNKLAALCAVLLFFQPLAAQYRTALPGYHYEFPRDHFSHSDFQTEWWYYTGNLVAADGHQFGFELTFFRQAVTRDASQTGSWDVRDLFLAHLALSDLDDRQFYHSERLNRAGPGIAGVNADDGRIWNGNWQVRWDGERQMLQAVEDRFALHLTLEPEKRPVIHGENGISQKAEGAGRASHYISFTRLASKGEIELHSKEFEVAGLAWMDHEFFTHELDSNQTGWDWLSIQLADKTDLMLYRIRRKDGSIDPYSSGTYVDAQGKSTHLRADDFTLRPSGATWTSPVTHAAYPIEWNITIPRLGVELHVTTPLPSQELTGTTKLAPNYWEGAIRLTGKRGNSSLDGLGYLEMTGYDKPVKLPH
jgi:predicted secreted hydrolase